MKILYQPRNNSPVVATYYASPPDANNEVILSGVKHWHSAVTIIRVHYHQICACNTDEASTRWPSFAFDGLVNVTDEEVRGAESNAAQHEEEAEADARHVPEEERGLHEAAHVGTRVIIVEAVSEDEHSRRASAQDSSAEIKAHPD